MVDFNKMLKDHMENQPHNIRCTVCERDLEVEITVDGDFDLLMDVEPCECTKEKS